MLSPRNREFPVLSLVGIMGKIKYLSHCQIHFWESI